ncbi:PAS domain S-box protein [Pseudomonas sp.]|uniref:PAS domain S-box protein n=1 Tax=Pseudomonas sp. TaxID=306 RepID=UPI003BB79239
MRPDLFKPMRLAGFYLLFSSAWIFLSDGLLASLSLDSDHLNLLQTYKGLAFVVLSTLLIFILSYRDQLVRSQLSGSLHHSSRLLQQAQRNASLGSWEYLDGGFNWSAQALRLLDQPNTPHSSLEQLLSWLHPADRSAAQRALEGFLKGTDALFIQLRRNQPGHLPPAWLLLRGEADEHGRLIGTIQDISSQKHDEEALRESEQRLRQLFEQTPRIAVQGYDDQHRVIYWNQASTQLYGYAAHEAMGKTLEELIIPPPMRQQVINDVQRMLSGGAPVPAAELQLQRKDGSRVWVYSSHLLIHNAHDRVELYCVDIDLSEQKASHLALQNSEARYRQLVTQLDEAIFLCDAQQRLTLLNPAWAIISGHAERQSLGKPLSHYLYGDDALMISQQANDILAGRLTGWAGECRLRCADGTTRWVELHLSSGELPGYGLQGSLNDIHAQHQTQELQEARNAVLDQLLAHCPLAETLSGIANRLEALSPDMRVSIMRLHPDNSLYVVAAPSLPSEFSHAINGVDAESGIGPCGQAAVSGELIINEDLQNHPNWQTFQHLALATDLRACWSLPFKNEGGEVLGTFGIYYRTVKLPTDDDIALVTEFTRLAGLAVQQQQRESARQHSEERFRATFEQAAIGIAHVSPEGRFLLVNSQICNMLGCSQEQLLEQTFQTYTHPDDLSHDLEQMQQLLNGEISSYRMEKRYYRADRSLLWANLRVTLIRHSNGEPHYFISVVEDISLRKQHEQALRQAATVFESTREAVVVVDGRHRILASNPAYSEITGQAANAVLGTRLPLLYASPQERARYRSIWRGLKNQGNWTGELNARRADGSLCPLWLNASRVADCEPLQAQYVLAFTDLSQFKDSQQRLAHLAHYDPLTDLPNRLFAHERLSHALQHAQRHQEQVAVLFIDLDHFKTINDGLGHAVGDELLVTVARRLQQRLRNEDTLARLGGDEFLVILENLQSPDEAAHTAQALLKLFERPLPLGHQRDAYLGASIGISFYPDDGQNSDELIRNADAALYQAKAEGRNTYRFYTKALTERAHNRLTLESQLRQAIKRGEFILYYQPLVDTLTGKPLGVEALVRWNSPQGMISPADFIPLAEDTGLIVPIGTWVLREACRQAQALRSQGFALETLAVNLSPRQFRQADLLKQVRDALHDSGLPAACLELEITEGALMDDVAQTQATLSALKSLGLRLAVDDFGTGYSSLAYLRRFPLDKLKIDQSFMRGVPTDQGNLEIVATIIALARTLNLTVIAEGVETHEQHQALCQLACEQCQGYLFSRPLSIEQLHDWLAGDRQAVG